jgi:ribosomal protein S8
MKICNIPVNTTIKNDKKNDQIFIYFNKRKEDDLFYLKAFMNSRKLSNYKIFKDDDKYNNEFIQYVNQSKFGIILCSTENNVIQTVLSYNVPILVWNMKTMDEDKSYSYPPIQVTCLKNWDNCCGEVFYDCRELGEKYDILCNKLTHYRPKDFICNVLSKENFINEFIKIKDELKCEIVETTQPVETVQPVQSVKPVQPVRQVKRKRGIFSGMRI